MTTIDSAYLRNTLDTAAIHNILASFDPAKPLDTREMKRQFVSLATPNVYLSGKDFYSDAIELRFWPDVHVSRSRADRRFFPTTSTDPYLENWWTRVRFSNAGMKVCFNYSASYFLLAYLLDSVAQVWKSLSSDQIADYSFMLGWEQIELPGGSIWMPRLLIPIEGWERSKTVAEKNKWVSTVVEMMRYFSNEELYSGLMKIAMYEGNRGLQDPRYSESAHVLASVTHSARPVWRDVYCLLSEDSRDPSAKPDLRVHIERVSKAPPQTLSFYINDNIKG